MTKQSAQAIRQIFTVQQPRDIEKNGKALLARVAREGIAKITREQTARAGIAPSVEVMVAGGGQNIDSVKVPGPIVALFDYRREIALYALDQLRRASPVKHGTYVTHHMILLNGTEVPDVPANLSKTDILTLTNDVPYARRIEIGKTKAGRDFVLKVPNRIYERVAKNKLSPRYPGVARITFEYIALNGAYETTGGLSSHYLTGKDKLGKGGKLRKRRQAAGTTIQAPAIVIRYKA